MNLSLTQLRVLPARRAPREAPSALSNASSFDDDSAHVRRLRSLLSLFALYATALFAVILFSDGPDIGCILMGIAGHVLYASVKTTLAWREASWFEDARLRVRHARGLRVRHAV